MKPYDIPQDIWDRSSMLWGYESRIGIARAIMAEQKRCAEIARNAEDMIGEVIAERIEGNK